MIKELDRVVLQTDLDEHGLKTGDIGTVVLTHSGSKGYEVEFITLEGETVTVTSLFAEQVRAVRSGEIAHARPLAG